MHRIEVDTEPGTTIVSATGELDAYAAPDLDSAFNHPSGDGSVVFDLTDVSFMDSTALGLLVRAVRELGDAGCEVRVVLPRSAARRIFEITTLDRVLPISESRSNALAELSPTA
ncbi:MAG TPA: STAS domain-containing protein [Gaiellaceae bacterium]|nr:STAS domain-containing protein [Gaiellaceae bacterium]